MSCTADRKQGRRSAEDAEKTKCRIMCVASQLFCEQGFDRVSIRNISEKAGVSHSLIRHHFGSKEKIWQSISDGLHYFMEEYRSRLMEEMGNNMPANEYLYHFATKMLALMLVNPAPIQLIADAVRQETGELVDYFINSTDSMQSFFLDLASKHNAQFPESTVDIYEFKWQMMLYSHGAASLKPFMQEIWPEETMTSDGRLLAHWTMFEGYAASHLAISPEQRLKPSHLEELVIMDMVKAWNDALDESNS
ncbi:TetR/AcrR family transcriptional regulator [Vibrio agarivorans]|uniref:TetR/AcrR family transcriptional regulator n=1 Tax=Vibrio agarivorans TaxID=153622 RepID=UPI002230DC8F|nr:TetR/AcrR family transcriptional regulator [Vibrio agarivorans]